MHHSNHFTINNIFIYCTFPFSSPASFDWTLPLDWPVTARVDPVVGVELTLVTPPDVFLELFGTNDVIEVGFPPVVDGFSVGITVVGVTAGLNDVTVEREVVVDNEELCGVDGGFVELEL